MIGDVVSMTNEDSGQLTGFEQGIVLGALIAPQRVPSVLARVAPLVRQRCGQALDELEQAGRTAKLSFLQRVTLELSQPWPATLGRVDVSWVEAALRDQPAVVVAAVVPLLPKALRSQLSVERLSSPGPSWAARWRLAQELFASLCLVLRWEVSPQLAAVLAWPARRLQQSVCASALLGLSVFRRRAGAEGRLELALTDPYDRWLERASSEPKTLDRGLVAYVEQRWSVAIECLRLTMRSLSTSEVGSLRAEYGLVALGYGLVAPAVSAGGRAQLALRLPEPVSRGWRHTTHPASDAPDDLRLILCADRWQRRDPGGAA